MDRRGLDVEQRREHREAFMPMLFFFSCVCNRVFRNSPARCFRALGCDNCFLHRCVFYTTAPFFPSRLRPSFFSFPFTSHMVALNPSITALCSYSCPVFFELSNNFSLPSRKEISQRTSSFLYCPSFDFLSRCSQEGVVQSGQPTP